MANLPEHSQRLARAAHSLRRRRCGWISPKTHSQEKAYLADAFGVPVEIFLADAGGGDPQGQEQTGGAEEAGDIYLSKII